MNSMTASWLVMGGAYLLVTAASVLQPYMAPRNILFGVSVPDARREDDEVVRLKRSYVSSVLGASVLIAAITIVLVMINGSSQEEQVSIWFTALPIGALLLQLAFSGGWFVLSHSKALRLKEERGWEAEETRKGSAALKPRSQWQIAYPLTWFLPHLLVIAISAGAAWLFYDRIPEQIIMHYNAQGFPDRIEEKSLWSVFQLNFVQIGMLAVFLFSNYSTQAARAKLHPDAPEEHREQQIRYRRGISLLMLLLGLGIVIFMGMIQAFTLYGGNQQGGALIGVAGMIPLLLSGAAVFSLMRLGKDRIEAPRPGEDGSWKAGMFYWNRNDASIFVEKRSGLGFTLNWGNPISWIFLGIIIVLIIVSLIIGTQN
ncbi:DUF1648 domain-containing protein [Paenibacillus herberti]|nr:DUF5808 domain-containing protein [Paenibacillus herberti]